MSEPRTRVRPDRGAVLIEFALVMPILLGLFAAVVDLGMAFGASRDAVEVVRSTARVEANLGHDRQADREGLLAAVAGLGDFDVTQISRLIVYKAATADGAVPAACRTVAPGAAGGGVSGVCNVYGPAQLESLATSRFGGSLTVCEPDDWDRWYCPLQRETRQGSLAGPDYVGVWIEVQLDWFVGVLPGRGPTIAEGTVMRIEPRIT